jgi:1,4-alpha-glucan branching enzyme
MNTSKFVKGSTTAKSTTSAGIATANEPKPAGPPRAVQSLGPRQVADTVIFVASYPQAAAVQIAGDFNDWKPEKNPMRKSFDGTWQASVHLAKGVYKYRLVVDGNWQQDPHNNAAEPNQYGEMNSVLKVV